MNTKSDSTCLLRTTSSTLQALSFSYNKSPGYRIVMGPHFMKMELNLDRVQVLYSL